MNTISRKQAVDEARVTEPVTAGILLLTPAQKHLFLQSGSIRRKELWQTGVVGVRGSLTHKDGSLWSEPATGVNAARCHRVKIVEERQQ